MIKPIFLFASDDPETVPSPGRLMSATVSSAEPCRLYFDHVNGSRSTLRLAVVARNTGRSRATLSVSESYGGPGYDFMAVGHAATKRFLINRDSQTPIQREVAPGNAVTLYDTTFVSHQCLCGIADYASDQEDSMELYVLAVAPDDDPLTACTSAPNCPPDRFNRKGKFDISNTPNTSLGFSVGAAHVDFEIGDRALPNLIIDPGVPHPQPLQGEYAIIQHALITIANPTLTEATVVLVVSPRGGSATGTYKINGIWYEHGRIDPGTLYRLRRFTLQPGASSAIDLTTASELNSSYPVLFRVDVDRTRFVPLTLTQF